MGTEVIGRKEGISLYQQKGSLEEFEFAIKDATLERLIHLNTVMNYNEVYYHTKWVWCNAASQYLFVSYNVNCFLFTSF